MVSVIECHIYVLANYHYLFALYTDVVTHIHCSHTTKPCSICTSMLHKMEDCSLSLESQPAKCGPSQLAPDLDPHSSPFMARRSISTGGSPHMTTYGWVCSRPLTMLSPAHLNAVTTTASYHTPFYVKYHYRPLSYRIASTCTIPSHNIPINPHYTL